MRLFTRVLLAGLCMFVFVLSGSAMGETGLLSSDIVMKEGFTPGVGAAVGEMSQISGKVAVLHQNEKAGYWAKEGDKLYKGDAVITLAEAYASLKLEDGSFMSLSPQTRLEVTKSVYAPEKGSRSTFMDLITGKTRFIVKKLVEAKHSEFKVKTSTSVAGVRGSDFIIIATDTDSEVTTLQDTELEVVSLAAPEAKPLILHDFERTRVKLGVAPEEARKVTAQEVDRLMKEFKFTPAGGKVSLEKGEAKKEEVSAAAAPAAAIVNESDLINPVLPVPTPVSGEQAQGDRVQVERQLKAEQEIEDQRINIIEEKNEDIKKTQLPDFPGTP